MQHDYYKEYYELERSHWWFQAREQILSRYIATLIDTHKLPHRKLNIANIGCGPGRSSEYLSAFGSVSSIEYDADCCAFASERTGLNIQHGSITELPFEDGVFDLVCAFDVIEHVEDDALAVSELKRVAKPGAVILITVPAFMSLWSHHDVVNHHFRRYDLQGVKTLFNGADGQLLFASYFNFFLFPPIYVFRKIANWTKMGDKRNGSGSDFEAFKPGIINRILYAIMKFESRFVNSGIRFPFGVSIIHSWQKK